MVWATAFAAVFSFYAHAVFHVPSSAVTPISAPAIAGGLGALASVGVFQPIRPAWTTARRTSVLCLAVAWGWAVISVVLETGNRRMEIGDWGAAAVQIGMPALMYFIEPRARLLNAIGFWCVGAAFADFER